MSPQPSTLLDELWESIPTGPAPDDDLVQRGRTRRRRRRLGVAGGALALVVAAGVAISVIPRSGGHEDHLLTPPAGTRYVGIGQVAVAVPEDWSDGDASCNAPMRDTVFFPYGQDCVGMFHSVSSLAISAVRMNDGFAGGMTPDGRVGGHRVVARPNSAMCMVGTGPEACLQSFGVPDLHAYFSVRVPRDEPEALDRVKAIRDSLRVLPDGQTAVPFLSAGSLDDWRAALQDAGLAVRVDHHSCPPTGNCVGGVVSTTPAPGNVVPTGSIVTIDVQG
jgi:hypothetical protein